MSCSTSTARTLCCDHWARYVLHGLWGEHGYGFCGVQSEANESKQMTPADVKAARQALGMTSAELAAILRLGGSGARTVRGWESDAGKYRITGPATVALEALLSGWRPA